MHTSLAIAALGCLSLGIAMAEEGMKPLAAGDTAPPFSLKASDGKTYSLADFAGKKVVVVAWYPKAFTGG